MSGKGDADTRSPDLEARARTWDRVFGRGLSLADAVKRAATGRGRFETVYRGQVHSLEGAGSGRVKWRGCVHMHMARTEAMVQFLNSQYAEEVRWKKSKTN